MADLIKEAKCVLKMVDATEKALSVQKLSGILNDENHIRHEDIPKELIIGIPSKPNLVKPSLLSKRGFRDVKSKAALIHALAHIEFNAVNLALDAICRFRDLPEDYYSDWLRVACEEASHFLMLETHLKNWGYTYGDFDAHSGLWDMASLTSEDPLKRMAIVPRVLEARGLDVSPELIEKFERSKDFGIAKSLRIIYEDEIGHVRIGNKWYHYLCEMRKVDPEETFCALVDEYKLGENKRKINRDARRLVGFTETEINRIETGIAQ